MELDGVPASVLTTRGWNLNDLVSTHPNFRHVLRIHASASPGELLAAIEEHERTGVPLVIAGFQTLNSWPADNFSLETLQRYPEHEAISVRDVHSREDLQVPLPEFLAELKATPTYVQPGETRRLYGKDYPCPREWLDWLEQRSRIPDVLRPNGTNNALRNLPDPSDVETLMCYIGVGDTFTPSHKDLCASSGQNLMCYTSDDNSSSYWFMTASASTPDVAAYFHSLDSEVALESRVLTVNEYANAPFDVYVIEQKVGDLVLVPPRSCHQVVNNGGITAKLSWSRMTVPGLVAAYYHELPLYHRVCRPETYRIKATIYHSLVHLTEQMETDSTPRQPPVTLSPSRLSPKSISKTQIGPSNAAINELASLINIFDSILAEEYHPSHASLTHVQVESADSEWGSNTLLASPDDQNAAAANKNWHCTCDFCGADIFQSLFECKTCALDETNSGPASGFLLCPMCYVEGRSCKCGSMEPIQVMSFDILLKSRNRAASALQKNGRNYVVIDYPIIPISNCGLLVFKAAVVLHNLRQEDQNMAAKGKKFTRTCTTRMKHEPSHPVARANIMDCRGCHAFKCFKHILQMHGIHAAEALLIAADDDKKCTAWHARHLGITQDDITNNIGRAVMAERRGVPPIATDRLLKAARQYGTCRSLNPERVILGWYDNAPSANDTNVPPMSTATTTAVSPTDAVTVLSPSESEAPIAPQSTPEPANDALPLFLDSSPERPRDSPKLKPEERSDTPPMPSTPRTPGAEPGSQLMDCVLVPRRFSSTKNRRERSADPSIATLDTFVIHPKANKSRRSSNVHFASPSAKRRKLDPPLPNMPSDSIGRDVGASSFGKSAPSSTPVTRNQRMLSDPQEDANVAHQKRRIDEVSSNGPSKSVTSTQPADDTISDNLASRLPNQSAVQANRLQKSSDEPARTDHQRPKLANEIVRISTAAGVVSWPRNRVKRAKPNLRDVFKQTEEQLLPGRPSTSQVLKAIKIRKKPSELPVTQVAPPGHHHVSARHNFLHDPLAAGPSAPPSITTSPSRAVPGTSSIFPAAGTYAPSSSYVSNTRPADPVDPRRRPSAPTNSGIPCEIITSQPPPRPAPFIAPSLPARPAPTTSPTTALPPPTMIPPPMPESIPPQPPPHTPSQASYLALQTENLMLRLKLQQDERLREAQVKDGVKEALREVLPGMLREAQAASGQRLLLDGPQREDRRDVDRDYDRSHDDQRHTDRRNYSSERRSYDNGRGGYDSEDGRRNEEPDRREYADDRRRYGYDSERDHRSSYNDQDRRDYSDQDRSNYNDRDRRDYNDSRGYRDSSTYHFDEHPSRPEPSSWHRPRDDPPYENMRRGDNAGSNYWDQPEDGELVMRHDEYERNRGSGSYSNVPAFPPRPALADRISSSPSRAERWRMGGGRGERGRGGVGSNWYPKTDSHRFEEIPDDDPRASGSSQSKPGPSRR